MAKQIKKANYNIGDEVYFAKYSRAVDKVIKPNMHCKVMGVTEIDGQPAIIIEHKTGLTDTVLNTEVKLKGRLSKELVREANKTNTKSQKIEKVNQNIEGFGKAEPEFLEIDAKESNEKFKLLATPKGQDPKFLMLTDELQAMVDKSKDDPLKVAHELLVTANKAHFKMGGVLALIYLEDIYKDKYGYTGSHAFKRFVEENLQMKERRARYFMEIYVCFTNLGVPETIVSKIPWSIAAEICRYATKENVNDLIKVASQPGVTKKIMVNFCKENYTSKEGVEEEEVIVTPAEVNKYKHYSFSVFEEQGMIVEEALEYIYEKHPELDRNKKSQAFAVLFADYLNKVNIEEGTVTRESLVSYSEAVFPDSETFIRNRKTGVITNPRYEFGQVHIQTAEPKELEVEVTV